MIDGYHGFCAVPTSLETIQDRVFYVAGGYKYAQAGEGACFLVVPSHTQLRPANTGWFASFGTLSQMEKGKVGYSDDAFRFWGATFDPSGIYRFNAVMRWMQSIGLTIPSIHAYIVELQTCFLKKLDALNLDSLHSKKLIFSPADSMRGHFLTFDLSDAAAINKQLHQLGVEADRRDTRLRFGFGLYHDRTDVDRLIERLKKLN